MCDKIEKLYEVSLRNYGSPLEGGYHPEVDRTDLLVGDEISRLRLLIDCYNWTVTLGRCDVNFAVSMMGRFNAAPRKGHVDAMLRVFGYLKHHMKRQIIFDVSHFDHSEADIEDQNWGELYPGVEEELPPIMPEAKGKPVKISTFFDADHAHD